ncbi:MAG: site-specific integrase, partial [Janthinobacterium sp.]
MDIELFKDPDSDMLIPFVKGTLQKEFFEFLVYRYHWPTRINRKMNVVDASSLRNIAYDIKQLLEALAYNNVHISDVTYDQHLKKLLDEQQNTHNWRNETFNTKYSRYRDFFEFLTFRGISHKAIFPAKRERIYYSNSEDDFLSHIQKRKGSSSLKDDGHEKTTITDNYFEYVISMDTYCELYRRLKRIDPVYAVMAQTMMQTCLRVSNVCQIPLSHSKLNPNWKLWPELQALNLDFLKFHHIAKGGKLTWCYVWPATTKSIYDDYIVPCFTERKKLYSEIYSKRKNASLRQGKVILPDDILWLNENGTPIKPYMLEEAFRRTEMNIHPHCLRHTGATHLLWNYCNLNGIDTDERMAAQFHSFLQYQLGHHSIETTRYYIRTITCKRAQIVVPFALPGNREEIDKRLPEGAAEQMKMLEFFAGATKEIT